MLAVLAVLVTAAFAEAQRCAGVPSYSPRRVSLGAQYATVDGGGSGGGLVRAVRGAATFDVRAERMLADVIDRDNGPSFVDGTAYAGAVRYSIPTRDGWTAICLITEVGSARQSIGSRQRTSGDVTGGIGYAVPGSVVPTRKVSLLFEYRVSHHWSKVDWETDGRRRWWEQEVSVAAGAALTRDVTVLARIVTADYDRDAVGTPAWKPPRAMRFQLGLQYHYDYAR